MSSIFMLLSWGLSQRSQNKLSHLPHPNPLTRVATGNFINSYGSVATLTLKEIGSLGLGGSFSLSHVDKDPCTLLNHEDVCIGHYPATFWWGGRGGLGQAVPLHKDRRTARVRGEQEQSSADWDYWGWGTRLWMLHHLRGGELCKTS